MPRNAEEGDVVSGPWMRGSSCSKRDTQRDGAMWLPSALLLLSVPGFSSLSGPSTVTGTEGGSLSVQCRYEEKYKAFTKYWCRQPCLLLWNQMVETRGSEGEVRSGRVSIVDHSADLTFTVTLENLTTDDAGKYRCGIATILREEGLSGFLPDLFFQVQVFVSPRSLPDRVHFLLLIFLKVPLLLIMLSAVLWVNRPQWAICGKHSQPDDHGLQPSLPIDILSRDITVQTTEGGTSAPKLYFSSHFIAKNL
ncbi:protein CD300H-like [Lynx canadensis]|nr:protein CD300H-like [Lynx canadensis]XP_046937421.1 protein CD300H-like [Lynx rufus]